MDVFGLSLSGTNLSYTNIAIDPQKVKNKDLSYVNLKGINLLHADFMGVNIVGADLCYISALIDPQMVLEKVFME